MANEPEPAVHSRTTFDFAAHRSEVLRVSDLIGSMVPQGKDNLLVDVNKLADTFELQFKEFAGGDRTQVSRMLQYLMEAFDRAACATDWRLGYGKVRQDATIPEVAISLLRSAAGLLANAFSAAGVKSYINRNDKFIEAMAEFAVEANGSREGNRSFYEQLGRQVAVAVLEHDPPRPVPALAPCINNQEHIIQAALEQMVYFIQCGDTGPVKVGIAKDPHARLANLQTGHHDTLVIRAIVGGGAEREREYHQQFSQHSLRGEWFTPHPDILAEIERLNHKDHPA